MQHNIIVIYKCICTFCPFPSFAKDFGIVWIYPSKDQLIANSNFHWFRIWYVVQNSFYPGQQQHGFAHYIHIQLCSYDPAQPCLATTFVSQRTTARIAHSFEMRCMCGIEIPIWSGGLGYFLLSLWSPYSLLSRDWVHIPWHQLSRFACPQ